MKNVLNIPEINKRISQKHSEFIKKACPLLDKVLAEEILRIEQIFSKVKKILECFSTQSIIDTVEITKETPYKKILIGKKGMPNHIEIIVHDKAIALSFFEGIYLSEISRKLFIINELQDYDWISFSEQLLDCIHSNIYMSKKIFEARIDLLFQTKQD